MLVDDQVDHQGLQAWPVAGRGRGHTGRQRAHMLPAAAATDPPHLMLGHLDADLRQIKHLMRALHPHVPGGRQVRPASAAPHRAVTHRLIRGIHPAQPAAWRTRLLPPLPPRPAVPAPPAFRLATARQHIVAGRRQRRVPRMAGDDPLQPGQAASQLGVLFPQRRDLTVPGSARGTASSGWRQTGHRPP